MLRRLGPALVCLFLLAAGAALAEDPRGKAGSESAGIGPASGLPVPRFVSLRSAEVNVRTGPGTRYPVEWVFVRREMPVEITAEFETWRRIRDWQGTEGWVHQSMLTGRRAVLVTGGTRTLRRSAGPSAEPVAQAESGVVGRLLHCTGDYCQVDLAGYKGWLPRREFWGTYPNETVE